MHVDIASLDQAARSYRFAADAAVSIQRDYAAAAAYVATGLDGDSARRADEKISATERALYDAESSFQSAARIIETLSDTLTGIKSSHDTTNRSLSNERTNLRATERRLAGETDEVEIVRLKKKIKLHKSEIKRYEGQLRTLEDEAKNASKRASGELESLTGWADAARSAAFYRTPLGKGIRLGKGFVIDGIVGTLDGLEDLTIKWLYDPETAMESWKALGTFVVAASSVAGGQLLWYHVVGGDRSYDEFVQDQYDIFFGGLKVAVHWDEFGEDPWRAAGAAGWDVATLLAGVGVTKLSKVQAAGKLSKGGRAALATLQTVEVIDDPLKISKMLPNSKLAIDPSFKNISEIDKATVPLLPSRLNHILYGDATGGGHAWPGQPNKTPFPPDWSESEISKAVAEIVRDPNVQWRQQTGSGGALYTKAGDPTRFVLESTVDGVRMRVIVEPAGQGVITAFPY